MKIRLVAAFAALLLQGLASGCANKDIIDPVIDIPEKRSLVVVPFQDEQYENGFDSPRGCDLAARVTSMLKEKAEFRVKKQDVVISLYDENNPRHMTAKEVAEKTGADYVLMGHILKWRTKDDNMYSPVYLGNAIIEVSLYETAAAANERVKDERDREDLPANGRGRLAIAKQRVTASFPHEYGFGKIGSYEMGEAEVEAGLMNTAAMQVSWLFIPHTKDEEKLVNSK